MAVNEWRYVSLEGPSTHDNDGILRTFTVPDRENWHILSMWVEYTASDTAATRQIRIQIVDQDSDIMLEIAPGATQILSEVRFYSFYPGAPDLTSFRDSDLLTTPLPAGLVLRPNWGIKMLEESSGDTTDSDVFLTQMMFASEKILSTEGLTPQSTDN